MWNRRMKLTGSRSKALSLATFSRSLSITKAGEILYVLAASPRPALDGAGEPRRHLGVNLLQCRADDGSQVADVLGDEAVVLHEALDLAQPRMLGVAEAERHLVLHVEGKALLGAA